MRQELGDSTAGAGCPGPATGGEWANTAHPRRLESGHGYTVAREVLSADPALPNDAVIVRLKARGVKGADTALRLAVNSVRKKLRKKAAPPAPKPMPVAARETSPAPKAAPAEPAPAPASSSGLADVLSNVALVNAVVAACGGVEHARQVAEAVRACGGPDGFAQYLDLVAGIRTS